MSKQLWIIVSLVISAFLLSCSTVKQVPVGHEEKISGSERPKWVDTPVEEDTKDSKAFVGLSLNEKMESKARAGALEDARKQIIDAMGVYGKRKIDEVISTFGSISDIINPGIVRDEATKMVSENIVKSRSNQFHIERWKRITESGVDYYYKAYVLVLFPNDQAAQITKDVIELVAKQAKDEQDKRSIDRALEAMKELKSNDW